VFIDQTLGECTAVLLLPDNDQKLLYKLITPLKRSGVELPQEIQDTIDDEWKQRALRRGSPLCFEMKSYGYCK